MKVSGTIILTRKTLICRKFGAEAWHGLFRDVAASNPALRRPITAKSTVELADFLAFQDELGRRFYDENPTALFDLGGASARWVLVDGPLKNFVKDAEIHALVESMPKLWHCYFSETDSRSEAELTPYGVEFRVRDLPAWHPYFEHFVMGYMKEMLELYCANPVGTERLTLSNGTSYGYLLATDPLVVPSPPTPGSPRMPPRSHTLTERELEVLRLVGTGKTNREIAMLLAISPKTVQHHVAHAYDKLGIYSRAGAALWLAERGLAS